MRQHRRGVGNTSIYRKLELMHSDLARVLSNLPKPMPWQMAGEMILSNIAAARMDFRVAYMSHDTETKRLALRDVWLHVTAVEEGMVQLMSLQNEQLHVLTERRFGQLMAAKRVIDAELSAFVGSLERKRQNE